MNPSPESHRPTLERESSAKELENAAHERREALREAHETVSEHNHDKVDEARREAIERARSIETISKKHEKAASPAERRTERMITQKDRDASFVATMSEVQTHMTPASRSFSRVIHNKTVEKVSETTAATIARPNAILSGAVMAFIVTLALYLIAKNLGYVLSGFETIGAFVFGWVLGIAFDFLKVMITGRK